MAIKVKEYDLTLYGRVVEEMEKFDSAEDAAIDHLEMTHAHLHEEFEGRDMDGLLTEVTNLLEKVKKLKSR